MSLFEQNFLTRQTAQFMPKTLPHVSKPDCFEVNYTIPLRHFMTDAELISLVPGTVMCFDGEFYHNYTLFAFKHMDTGWYLTFESPLDVGKLRWVMQRFLLVGFNSRNFDIPIAAVALTGADTAKMKRVANEIVNGRALPYQIERTYNVKIPSLNHIDLFDVAPLFGSLKLYGARLHSKRIQDLPLEEDAILTRENIGRLYHYCLNDVDNTELVLQFLMPQLNLRYQLSTAYHVDLRSKSDAQIAEAVISKELERLTGRKPEKQLNLPAPWQYRMPPNIFFQSQELKEVQAMVAQAGFAVNSEGELQLPVELKSIKPKVGGRYYKMGLGGLHSTEHQIAHRADNGYVLLDRDVASYYPSIILNQQLYPAHLGPAFLEVYRGLVQQRLYAKRTGDKITSDALKITVNGTFGKLGNRWSILYSPQLLVQVTMTGQLALLMLIDMIESLGVDAHVISANTDGVMMRCHERARQLVTDTILKWESITGFQTEETEYSAVYSADVNNYIAIKKDGTVKTKGGYSERGSAADSPLSRNPEGFVCLDAVIAYLTHNVPLDHTIRECKDIRRFVAVRNVKGGAEKFNGTEAKEVRFGRVIRWYYSRDLSSNMLYCGNKNKVPMTDGGKPLMELPDALPDDIDYKKYNEIASNMLIEIGAINPTPGEKLHATFMGAK